MPIIVGRLPHRQRALMLDKSGSGTRPLPPRDRGQGSIAPLPLVGSSTTSRFLTGLASPPGKAQQAHQSSAKRANVPGSGTAVTAMSLLTGSRANVEAACPHKAEIRQVARSSWRRRRSGRSKSPAWRPGVVPRLISVPGLTVSDRSDRQQFAVRAGLSKWRSVKLDVTRLARFTCWPFMSILHCAEGRT